MKYVIYISTSTSLFADAELEGILTISQKNNAINKLTGMLLYSEGCFVQVLEGAMP
ncbi:BLUF domain-containing protein [Mucilaginibacter paludis]|uniref:BLUF domain-containing protein n=1 Tax=Mucilaginibacter paludis TaxID=423351 RepID=UPI0001E9E081|nr:BLUF domain-containing protein [Mucilaginibacter paludis]